jgi:hypothetical protein
MMTIGPKYAFPAAVVCAAAAWAASDEAASLSSAVANLDALHRVTTVPHRMDDTTVFLCRVPTEADTHIHMGVHEKPAYCHVYVTADAKEPMKSGKGLYPRGSVVIKEKLASKKGGDAVLYTVMRKMEEGYDSKHGNWEYAVLDGASHRVLARGKIDSCIECHEHHASTDYVTRAYIK